jgi:glutaconate CoA-transferase subunit B
VSGECDVVCSIGYNPDRLPRGYDFSDIDIRRIITDLCVMDFGGPDRQMRVVSLHPGVPLSEVQENTGFEVAVADDVYQTELPTAEQLRIIEELDPLNARAKQIKDNPPGERRAH